MTPYTPRVPSLGEQVARVRADLADVLELLDEPGEDKFAGAILANFDSASRTTNAAYLTAIIAEGEQMASNVRRAVVSGAPLDGLKALIAAHYGL